MKYLHSTFIIALMGMQTLAAQDGLYSVGIEDEDSLPLQWIVGASIIYDDNVNAGQVGGAPGIGEQDSMAFNPSVGLSFVKVDPQTTIDVFARLGLIHYFDAPSQIDDINSQSRVGLNVTHRFSERLRYVSRNFVSYELEPDYAFGFASSRIAGEYFFWGTDHSIGYRWSERVGTYTGIRVNGTTYTDVEFNDRLSAEAYNQFRYQLTPNTVLTADYRYGWIQGDGGSSDSTQQFFLGGVEHRFSPNTTGVLRAGLQLRDVADGSSNSSPYVEFALRTRISEQFNLRSFVRYGMEYFDTVQFVDVDANGILDPVEYDNRQTLRLGITGDYVLSPVVSMFGGIDYIPTSFQDGRVLPPLLPGTIVPELDEDLFSMNFGLNFRFTDTITGTVAYTYTDSSSDVFNRNYDRNRVSVGVTATF